MGQTKVTATGLPDSKRIFARLQTRAGAAMQRRGAQLVSDARARWPMRGKVYNYNRPHSRDLFRVVYREDGTTLTLTVYNDARDQLYLFHQELEEWTWRKECLADAYP